MRRVLLLACVVVPVLLPALPVSGRQPVFKVYDVVVYGSTPAGVIAAVTAARAGKAVVLLEPGKHVLAAAFMVLGQDPATPPAGKP